MDARMLFKRVSHGLRANAREFNRQFDAAATGNGFQSRWMAFGGHSEEYEEDILRKVADRACGDNVVYLRLLALLRANSTLRVRGVTGKPWG